MRLIRYNVFPGLLRLALVVLFQCTLFQVSLWGIEPTAENVNVSPHLDGSKIVDIYYGIATADTTRVFVRIELSFDGGNTYSPMSYKSLSGDIGWVVPGQNKHIVWNIGTGDRKYDGDQFKIRISVDDNKNIATNKRYIAWGNADFFWEDYEIIIPLLKKYGFSQTFYVQSRPLNTNPNLSYYSVSDLNKIFETGSDFADHTFAHFTMTTAFPMADGYNSPTNDELRLDRGDGRNAFGIPLTTTIGSICVSVYLYTSGVSYSNTAFADLTDVNCQDIRKTISVFRRPTSYYQGSDVRLLEVLDYLSNRYLGTTGTGRNIITPSNGTNLPVYGDIVQYDANNKIAGGIYQGCSSTANHECWERLMQLHSYFHGTLLNRPLQNKGWFSSGGLITMFLYRNLGLNYTPAYNGGLAYMDSGRTLPASVYTKIYNTRTGVSRSLYDVEYGLGFRTGFEAGLEVGLSDGRNTTQFLIPNKLNSGVFVEDYDCLSTSFGSLHRYYSGEDGFSDSELQIIANATNPITWLYDRDKIVNSVNGKGLFNAVNDIVKWSTWGTIPKFADDSGQSNGPYQAARRAMLTIQIDTFFKFCYLSGIQIVSYEKAVELCQQQMPAGTNYFPNPFFLRTIDDVIGSTVNPQIEPDGWVPQTSGCLSVNYDNTLKADCMNVTAGKSGTIRQYMIAPGSLGLSFKARGHGMIKVYGLLNKSLYNITSPYANILATVSIDSDSWQDYSSVIQVPVAPPVSSPYEYTYCKGRDNQICGLLFSFSANPNQGGVSLALPSISE